MLGIVLLLFALYCYYKPRLRHISYLIYLSFMLGYGGGFGLTTDAVLGVKNLDLAIVYTFVVSIYLLLTHKYKIPNGKYFFWYKLFIGFLFCCVVFSYVHYGFSLFQILQGGRDFLLIFSLPILMRITRWEFAKLMPWLTGITAVTAVLYILQVVLGRALMPYSYEFGFDAATGLARFYNSPALLSFFLSLSFIAPGYFGRKVNWFRIILFVSLICTLGRTGIFVTVLTVLLCIAFMGKASKVVKTVIVIGFLFLPFADMLSARFEEGGTENDLKEILKGSYKNYQPTGDATMLYRFAWVYERFDYLRNCSLGEQVFGLGLISESQPIINKMYRFHVGNISELTGYPSQLSTPDISYGNIIARLGFGGGAIYLIMVLSFALFFFKYRRSSCLSTYFSVQTIILLTTSFSGSMLAETKNFAMSFVVIGLMLNAGKEDSRLSERDKLLFKPTNELK